MSTIDMSKPFVSCFCPTFGRPEILEEAIESFLRQDYTGLKELVILNDCNQQELVFDHPEIRIFNSNERIAPLGKKFNECVSLCKGEVLFVWDDDDIYLPWRISYSIRNLQDGVFHTTTGYYEPDSDQKLELTHNYYHSNTALTTELFEQIGGYNETRDVRGTDLDLMGRLNLPRGNIPIEECFYIYRWSGTNSYHGSQWDEKSGDVTVCAERYLQEKIQSGSFASGSIKLNPHWSRDWLKLVQEAIAVNDTEQNSKADSAGLNDETVLNVAENCCIEFGNERAVVSDEYGNEIFRLNGVGALLIMMINGRRSVDDMLLLLRSVFTELSDADTKQVMSFIDECIHHGVIQTVVDSK